MALSEQTPAELTLISGCYRVEGQLGHGGMARVYRVVDERSGQRLALKRMTVRADRKTSLQAMFEREYHALVQLAHPRIVRVFDYGLADGDPYYTMELLDGADAGTTIRKQPLDVRQICLLLRDVASALALIHSRRMVHRDVGPRNVWCTPDGHAKLIDFGTLVAMGPQARCAGTPPFVPPEAVYQQALDARCDLFALGALAYYLLTRRNAYPAREISELRQHWQRRPARPDVLKPELPRALSDLVMSLLSLDARGRPASASEVWERLTAIAELPAEDEQVLAAQAFLTSPKVVGRESVANALRVSFLRARRGRGSAISIVAPAGLGRSRMLGSFVLEAKLTGAATVALDASAVGAESLALGALLAERLLEALPLAAAAAVEVAGVLSHISPAVHRAFGELPLAALGALERERKLSSALVALVDAASRHQRLVIAVDDVHRADSASLGVLARIAMRADEQRLLLVTTCDEAALTSPPAGLEQLAGPKQRLDLRPLAVDQISELLASLFGVVPGIEELASFLHELSAGSPGTCMQYAQYLLDQKLARYEGGRWQLPQNPREQALPATLDGMLEARLGTLSHDARALLLGLLLARDETRAVWQAETHVRVEDFPMLLGIGVSAGGRRSRETSEMGRTFGALDELLRSGMLQQRDSFYVLGQRAAADALLRLCGDEERRRMHERLAAVLEGQAYEGRMSAVRQLQRAGKHQRAREKLASFASHLGGSGGLDWGAMRVSVSSACAQAALADWQTEGGSALEGILLRRMLLLTCSVYDWANARCAHAQI